MGYASHSTFDNRHRAKRIEANISDQSGDQRAPYVRFNTCFTTKFLEYVSLQYIVEFYDRYLHECDLPVFRKWKE